MKRIIIACLVIMALLCACAFAEELVTEEISGKVTLWERTLVIMDQDGNQALMPVNVTLEVKDPVQITLLPVADELADQLFTSVVTREGVGDVYISISPAERGLHYNLNDYTDEMLDEYIQSVVDNNYTEGTFRSEVLVSEGGNTYVMVEDDYSRTVSTIYEDFLMELYLIHPNTDDPQNVVYEPLTDEDKAFCLEISQGIWTEEPTKPIIDYALSASVNKNLLTDLGLGDFAAFADLIEQCEIVFHNDSNVASVKLVYSDNSVMDLTLVSKESGLELHSNLLGDKALYMSYEKLGSLLESVQTSTQSGMTEAQSAEALQLIQSINFDNTLAAAMNGLEMDYTEDGQIIIRLSAETASAVVNAFVNDIKASGSVGKLFSLFGMADSDESANSMLDSMATSLASFIPESGYMLDLAVSVSEDMSNFNLTGTVSYNTTIYTGYDETTNEFTTENKVTSTAFDAQAIMGADGSYGLSGAIAAVTETEDEAANGMTFDFSINADKLINCELAFGVFTTEQLTPSFSISLVTDAAATDEGNEETFTLSLNMADDNGNLSPMFTLFGKSIDSDGLSLGYLTLNIAGYEDPAATIRFNSIIGEEVTIEPAAEIINVDEMSQDDISGLMETLMTNFGAIFGA
ncbi:MAG: hypothetical protein IJT77_02715 [Clostridia bacterium]|nr:hypothetical protein [Clostridia bacterium]